LKHTWNCVMVSKDVTPVFLSFSLFLYRTNIHITALSPFFLYLSISLSLYLSLSLSQPHTTTTPSSSTHTRDKHILWTRGAETSSLPLCFFLSLPLSLSPSPPPLSLSL